MGLFSFLKPDIIPESPSLKVDIHSHLIHEVDDGSPDLESSMEMLRIYHELGYKKVITTPHIMQDFYKNGYENLKPKHEEILKQIEKENLDIQFEFAAEHYLDEAFTQRIKDDNVLTFGENYVLFETNFMSRPINLEQTIFDLQSKGYKPVFAHPERYIYLYDSFEKYEELYERGLLFQLNNNSISGYYSGKAKKIAEKLIDKSMVHFAGTDCHNMKHLNRFKTTRELKYYKKMLALPLLNDSLL